MHTHTTIRSWPSIVAGLACAIATGAVLLEDVWRGAQVTTTHGLSVLAIMVTIAAGHWALSDVKSRRVISGIALAFLSLAGTAYIVVQSGARNAEHATSRTSAIESRNADRLSAAADVKRARDYHGTAKAEEAKECVRIGPQCEKRKRAVDMAWNHVLNQEHRRGTMGPLEVVNGGYVHAAKVLAAMPGVTASADVIEDKLTLLMPFILVVLAEMGTILFIARGLGTYPPSGGLDIRTVGPTPGPMPGLALPTISETIEDIKRANGITVRRTDKKGEALVDLLAQLRAGHEFPSQDSLALRWGRPKQTVSDWVREWSEAGLIPEPRRIAGRTKMIAMA